MNIGFNNQVEENKGFSLVPETQDPYAIHRGSFVSAEYGNTRAVGKYMGLSTQSKLVISPWVRTLETSPAIRKKNKNLKLILDNSPLFISLEAVFGVGARTKSEVYSLLGYDSPEDNAPACLI